MSGEKAMMNWKNKFRKIGQNSAIRDYSSRQKSVENRQFDVQNLYSPAIIDEISIACKRRAKVDPLISLFVAYLIVSVILSLVCTKSIFGSYSVFPLVLLFFLSLCIFVIPFLPKILKEKEHTIKLLCDSQNNVELLVETKKGTKSLGKIIKHCGYLERFILNSHPSYFEANYEVQLFAFFGLENGNFIRVNGKAKENSNFSYPLNTENSVWDYMAKNGAEDVDHLLQFMAKSNSIDMRTQELEVKKELEELLSETGDGKLEE